MVLISSADIISVSPYLVAQQYGDIRLADSTETFGKGRLEVYFDGSWGAICFDPFKINDGFAQVACRQLGYKDWIAIDFVEKLK